MELDVKTIEKILELDRPEQFKIGEFDYIINGYNRIDPPQIKSLQVGTLQSIIDYLKFNTDKLNLSEIMIHVKSPVEVDVISVPQKPLQNRITYMQAVYQNKVNIGNEMEPQGFIIHLQTNFVQDEQCLELIRVCSKVTNVRETEVEDSGVSQTVNMKAGVVIKGEGKIKNSVYLKPKRSFPEIQQVQCNLAFRISGGEDDLEMVLHEADGGAWKIEAINAIKNYLESELKKEKIAIIG